MRHRLERYPVLDGLLMLTAVVVYALYHHFMAGYGFDDSFITYAVAQNLAQGRGLVFNPGEALQVSTTPLYTLVLSAFSALGLELPAVSRVLSFAFLTVDVALLLWLGRRLGSPWVGRIAAALFLFNPWGMHLGTDLEFFNSRDTRIFQRTARAHYHSLFLTRAGELTVATPLACPRIEEFEIRPHRSPQLRPSAGMPSN